MHHPYCSPGTTHGDGLNKLHASMPYPTRMAVPLPSRGVTRAATRQCLTRPGPMRSALHPYISTAQVPLISAPGASPALSDWQTRVGWAGRFAKCPAIPPGKLKKPHHLGQGKYAKVVRMREVATGRIVAIKKFSDGKGGCSSAERSATREFEMTRRLSCRHAVFPEAIALDPGGHKAFLVFPCIDGVALSRATPDCFSEAIARQVLKDLLCAMADLVAQGVAHNDVHGSNILVSKGRGFLIDFGLACANDSDILWRRDMALLRDSMAHFWPGAMSAEAREFFAWFKQRIEAKPAINIVEDVLQHDYISACPPV